MEAQILIESVSDSKQCLIFISHSFGMIYKDNNVGMLIFYIIPVLVRFHLLHYQIQISQYHKIGLCNTWTVTWLRDIM